MKCIIFTTKQKRKTYFLFGYKIDNSNNKADTNRRAQKNSYIR